MTVRRCIGGALVRILMIGDICGRGGRKAAAKCIPALKEKYHIDMTIANGENSAGGSGITKKVLNELYSFGIDVVTSGNHIWDQKEIFEFIDHEPYLIRPGNYPPAAPGRGSCIFVVGGKNVGVMNLSGRSFMPDLDCPFRMADLLLEDLKKDCDVILLDFHAETTSEKMAMGWYLDGRVSCVVGTHTHIQTADDRILPQGTAYITDLGMTGPWNSILGVKKELVIQKFVTGLPVRFHLAEGPNVLSGIVVTIDDATGKATEMVRVMERDVY